MRRRLPAGAQSLVAVLVAFVLVVFAVPAPAFAADTTISGVVSFGTAGNHPAGVTGRIRLDRWHGNGWTIDYTHVDADASGAYSVSVPENSRVRLSFDALQPGWQSMYYANRQSMSLATTIEVGTTPVTGIDQTVPAMGSISGHVSLGSSGVPAGAGQVKVSWQVCYEDGCISQLPPSTLTDASGNYSFPSLYNGTYTLSFQMVSGAAYQMPSPLTVVVSSAQPTQTGHDVTMPPASSISGTVYLGSTATPAGAGQVTVEYSVLQNAQYQWPRTVTTTAGGQYTIPDLQNGSYRLRFLYDGTAYAPEWYQGVYSERQSTSVWLTAPRTGIDAVLEPGGSISGEVTNLAGDPVPTVTVVASAYYGQHSGGSAYGPDYTVDVGSDGRYFLGGLPAGTYSLRLVDNAWLGYGERRIEGVEVEAGETVVIPEPTRFYDGAMYTGRVACTGCTDYAGDSPPRNEMYAVTETRESSSDPWVEVPAGTARVSGYDGGFDVRDLPPGEYRVVIKYNGSDAYTRLTRSEPFTLVEGQNRSLGTVTVQRYTNPVTGLYLENGGAAGILGPATSSIGSYTVNGGGSLQHYANGSIYSSNRYGTFIVMAGPIRDQYFAANSIFGGYGWPSGTMTCGEDRCSQSFGQIISLESFTTTVTVAPAVTGSPTVGGSLVASRGAYAPAATSFTYAWLRNGVKIPGATSSTYTPVAADVGQPIKVQVTAWSATGTAVTATSAPTAPISPTAAMQIAALRASNPSLGAATSAVGAFPNAGGGSLQHFANGSIYSSNLGGTWIVLAGPIRDQYFAASSISGVYGWPSSAVSCSGSTCTQTFTGGSISTLQTVANVPPTVGGIPMVGGLLTASNGSYTPTATSFTYRWFRGSTVIAGATAKTYAPVAADLGQVLKVEVTARSATGLPVTTVSVPTAAVAPSAASQIATLRAANPSLGAATTGVAAYPDGGGGSLQHFANGSIYSSNVGGTWMVPAGPILDAYWAAKSIFGTYRWPTGAQVCSGGTCSQTFVGGTLTAAPLAVGTPPSVGGAPRVGGTLVAAPGSYTPAATSLGYAWFRDGVRISGATASTYVPVAADEGRTLQVEVTAGRAGSVSVTTRSASTAAVAPSAASQIATLRAANPSLGAATTGVAAYPDGGGGSLQHFANGSIYSSNVGGTWVVPAGPIRDAYWAAKSIFGTYRWPTGAQVCASGTCTQAFVGGTLSAAPLAVTTAPALSGSPRVGATLSVSSGAYAPTATSYSYRWLRDGVTPIAGATASTYVPVAADEGRTLRAEVTASRAGSVSVTTLTAPSATVAPSAASQIATLRAANPSLGAATTGVAAYPDGGGGSLQHFANGSIYSSNVGGTWVVPAGPILDAYWAAKSIFGTYRWPTGALSCSGGTCSQTFVGGTLTASPLAVTTAPSLAGTARVGSPLTVNPGVYAPAATSLTYRWYRNGTTLIAGATAATYVPTAADQGHTIQAEVTAGRSGSVAVTTRSGMSASVAPSAASAIAALYAANSAQLGSPTSSVGTFPDGGGGSLQHFANGSIYSSNLGGTWIVPAGAVRTAYWNANSIFGVYRWPSSAQTCAAGTCTQQFTGGEISRPAGP